MLSKKIKARRLSDYLSRFFLSVSFEDATDKQDDVV